MPKFLDTPEWYAEDGSRLVEAMGVISGSSLGTGTGIWAKPPTVSFPVASMVTGSAGQVLSLQKASSSAPEMPQFISMPYWHNTIFTVYVPTGLPRASTCYFRILYPAPSPSPYTTVEAVMNNLINVMNIEEDYSTNKTASLWPIASWFEQQQTTSGSEYRTIICAYLNPKFQSMSTNMAGLFFFVHCDDDNTVLSNTCRIYWSQQDHPSTDRNDGYFPDTYGSPLVDTVIGM